MLLISSLLGSLPPWLSRKKDPFRWWWWGWGCSAVGMFSELYPGEPEESTIQTGRGSGLLTSVPMRGQMETDRMTLLHA